MLLVAQKPSKLLERVRIPSPALPITNIGAWRSLVAHSAGGRKVVGSNPTAPTLHLHRRYHYPQPRVEGESARCVRYSSGLSTLEIRSETPASDSTDPRLTPGGISV